MEQSHPQNWRNGRKNCQDQVACFGNLQMSHWRGLWAKWSGSGKQLASGGNDNVVHVWDRSAASSSSTTTHLLATGGGGGDGTIKFWNTHTGACLNSNHLALWKNPSLVTMAELTGHTSRVLYMAQSPDHGCTVASAAGDETLRFWDVFGMPETAKKPDQKAAHEPFRHVSCIR
ncbi:unnamed protein product [Brassica oleracea]